MNRITYIDTNYGQINRNNVSFKANRRTYEQDVNDVSMGCYTGLFRGDINWRRLGAYILSHFNNKDKVNLVMFASSDGSEAYSTIISLLEAAGDRKNQIVKKFFPVKAYDYDREILCAAKSGLINLEPDDRMAMQMYCEDYQDYFTDTDKSLFIKNEEKSPSARNVKTMKAKKVLTDNVRFARADMFLKVREIDDEDGNTILMCRNALGYFENDKIEKFIKDVSNRLKTGSLFIVGVHDSVLFDVDSCLKENGFEKVMDKVYKKT